MCMQYTLRNIPPEVDRRLRERARAQRKSLNEAALKALAEALGVSGRATRRRDLSGIAGTWRADPDVERALSDQHRVDRKLWK